MSFFGAIGWLMLRYLLDSGSVTYQLIHHDQNEVARNAVQGALDKWSIGEY